MTTVWYVFSCQHHGIVKSKYAGFKCKKKSCELTNITTFNFDIETHTWGADGPLANYECIMHAIREPRTREEYQIAFRTKSNEQLIAISKSVTENIENDSVGPTFCLELCRELKNRDIKQNL